jgi:hypothetical protein
MNTNSNRHKSTTRKTPNLMNSDLNGNDSEKQSVFNIVGGHVLPFKLPTKFGHPTQRGDTEMMITKKTSQDY